MAKRQRIQRAQPPPSSSSPEEEELSSFPDEEHTNNSTIPHPKKTPIQKKKRESEEEARDDEEDEEEDENPQYVKKTTPSRPEKEMLAPSKPPIPAKSRGKSPIVRIWSISDEIAILQAVLDHQSKNGPIELNSTVTKGLHDSIRKSLSIDVDTQKFAEKIKRMKKKYMSCCKKGATLKFPQAHDKTIYDICDKIWGNCSSRVATVNKGNSLKREFPFIRNFLGGNISALEMLEMADVDEAGAVEEKLRKIKEAELSVALELYKLLVPMK